MKQHNRLLVRNASEQQQDINRQQKVIDRQQQLIESLKHHVMPDREIIVLQVKYDELTGKVPFVPRYPTAPTRLYSEYRVVRGYKVRLFVETNDPDPVDQDHYGVYLYVKGGPFPCNVQYTFELVHYDGKRASAVKYTSDNSYAEATAWGCGKFVPKARLVSPDNNPYVKDGYLTFKCAFKFDQCDQR